MLQLRRLPRVDGTAIVGSLSLAANVGWRTWHDIGPEGSPQHTSGALRNGDVDSDDRQCVLRRGGGITCRDPARDASDIVFRSVTAVGGIRGQIPGPEINCETTC